MKPPNLKLVIPGAHHVRLDSTPVPTALATLRVRQSRYDQFVQYVVAPRSCIPGISSLLLLKPQVSSRMCRWRCRWRCRWTWSKRAWSTHATVSAIQEQTLSGRGAHVYTCTCVHDNIPCRRLPK